MDLGIKGRVFLSAQIIKDIYFNKWQILISPPPQY